MVEIRVYGVGELWTWEVRVRGMRIARGMEYTRKDDAIVGFERAVRAMAGVGAGTLERRFGEPRYNVRGGMACWRFRRGN